MSRKLKDYKIGEQLVEYGPFGEFLFTVTTNPVKGEGAGVDGRDTYRLQAVHEETKEVVNFLQTDGLECYGPSIYRYAPKVCECGDPDCISGQGAANLS